MNKTVKLLDGVVMPLHGDEAQYQLNAITRQDILNFASRYYAVPGRFYHNFDHVKAMVNNHRTYFEHDPTDALFFAIVMHDAIWIPGQSPRSEDMSEALVPYVYYQTVGQTIPLWFNDVVRQLIHWTIANTHTRDNRKLMTKQVGSSDVERILDLDLASMSRDWPEFVDIQRGIDLEFAHMGTPDSRMKASAAFLKQFIEKGFVYYSEEMRHLNEKALRNLKAYVAYIEKTNMASWDMMYKVDPIQMEGLYHT